MPIKKKKKTKVKKKVSKKVTKKSKAKKKATSKVVKESSKELIIKTKPQWIKSSLATKSNIRINILSRLKITMSFGEQREKE